MYFPPITSPASANGAGEFTITSLGRIPNNTIVPKTYIKVEMMVPIIVAIEIVLLGFFILLAGIVADSIPKKAYKVITQTIGKISKSL